VKLASTRLPIITNDMIVNTVRLIAVPF